MSPPAGPATLTASAIAAVLAVTYVSVPETPPAPVGDCHCAPCTYGPCPGGYSAFQLYLFGALCLLAGVGVTGLVAWLIGGLSYWAGYILACFGASVAGQAVLKGSIASILDRDIVLNGVGADGRRDISFGSPGSSSGEEAW